MKDCGLNTLGIQYSMESHEEYTAYKQIHELAFMWMGDGRGERERGEIWLS